jgi:hypothetical protein
VANPNSSGSRTSQAILSFAGTGAIQANITTSDVAVTAVPEPASLILLGSLVTGFALLLRRKTNRA